MYLALKDAGWRLKVARVVGNGKESQIELN